MNDRVHIDADGFVYLDGAKIARAEPGLVLAFQDRCKRRSSARGTNQPSIRVDALREALVFWEEHKRKTDMIEWGAD